MHALLSVFSGSLVGFSLGLVGGGGSVLAVPLLIYLVGVASPHIAIGTSAVAVAVSAAVNLSSHARMKHVKWPCAIVFALAGIAGVAIGARLGKAMGGQSLLLLFGVMMLAVGALMLLPRRGGDDPEIRLSVATARRLLPTLIGIGFSVGLLSGFFGIGGGFLIVPGLVAATGMPLIFAIGSSLVSVTVFGLTTAASYAQSGFVDWRMAAVFILGGLAGGLAGILLCNRLAEQKRVLSAVFAGVVMMVGLYVMARGAGQIG